MRVILRVARGRGDAAQPVGRRFGMVIALIAALMAAAVAGCSTPAGDTTTTDAPTTTTTTTEPLSPIDQFPEDLRFLALGDSFTEGTSIPPEGSWPFQLADALDTERAVSFDVVAGDGWNAKRLDREFNRAWDGSRYDLVFVGVGANDVVLPFGLENFREGLDDLEPDLAAAATEDAVLVVLSIPDFRASPWGQARIDRGYDLAPYNEVLAAFADEIGALFVDVTTISGQTVGDPTMFAGDDLHFSTKHYAEWVDLIIQTLS